MTEKIARPLALDYAAMSDRGLVRTNNEDSAVAAPNLLALADGMGGHAAGEVASELMITTLYTLQNTLSQGVEPTGDQLLTMLAEAMDDGNRAIAAHVDDNPTQEGMGCTLTTMLFDGSTLGVCHVGDSRGYLLRDGELIQITKDDTFVQSLVDEGRLAPEDVSSHPQRSLILKALTGRPVEPTLSLREAHAGDRYLLCSDGLSDPVSFGTIRDVLAVGTPTDAAAKLINLALRGGGPDNVTVVVADVVDPDTRDEDDEQAPLPTAPALAGAVNSNAPELPRPDTSAGRASAVNVVQRPRAQSSEAAADDAAPSEDEEPEPRGKRRKGLYIGLAAVLVLIVAAASTVWYVRDSLSQSYFIAVSDTADTVDTADTAATPADTTAAATATETTDPPETTTPAAPSQAGPPIQIYQGAPGTILGVSTQSVYQEVCLGDDADVLLLPAGSDDDCHRFSTSDLTPAARGTLDTLPRDSYEEIQGQIRRLAELTLPVCVTRDSDNGSNGADRADRAGNGEPSDLTTPGVSCREVH